MNRPIAHAASPAALRALCERLTGQLGQAFGVACSGVDGNPESLYPEERIAIQQAVPRRQREFAAGRQAAREAMARMGLPALAIPCAPDRSPIWPQGVTGSITHNTRSCVVVVCRLESGYAVGIDLETDSPLEPALWDTICTPEERHWIQAQPMPLRGVWATRMFSAKEAFYKWQYPRTRQMLEFHDVQVALNPCDLTFQAQLAPNGPLHPSTLGTSGQLMISDGEVLALCAGPVSH